MISSSAAASCKRMTSHVTCLLMQSNKSTSHALDFKRAFRVQIRIALSNRQTAKRCAERPSIDGPGLRHDGKHVLRIYNSVVYHLLINIVI